MSVSGEQIAFYSLAALTLIPAIRVVTTRNILHAGFWLLPCFVGVAGLFAALSAHFFFVVQLLIYAGAILVLILFALMLTRDVMNPLVRQQNRLVGWAIVLSSTLAIGSIALLSRHEWKLTRGHPQSATDQTRALGDALIGTYTIPFEVSSLLLLAALIGAVVLAKSEREPEADPPYMPISEEEPLEIAAGAH